MATQFPLGLTLPLSTSARTLLEPRLSDLYPAAVHKINHCAKGRKIFGIAFVLLADLSLVSASGIAVGSGPDLSSSQAGSASSSRGQVENDVGELEVGKPLERELAGGQHHSCQVTLAPGQFLHVVVEPHSIAATVTLFGPDAKPMMELEVAAGSSEPLYLVAKEQGIYRIEIRFPERAVAGSYRLKVEELKVATSQDVDRALAQSVVADGQRLFKERTAVSRRKAIERYQQALSLWRAVGDHAGESQTLQYTGWAYASLSEWQKALDLLNQALPLERAARDSAGEAQTLNYTGVIYHHLGESDKALEYYNQALPLWRAVGDRAGDAQTLTDIGWVYDLLGEKQKALDYYSWALPLAREGGDRRVEGHILNNTGIIYDALGERRNALDYYHQALLAARAAGNRAGEAQAFDNIAGTYKEVGERQKALDYYRDALALRHAEGNRAREAEILNNVGVVYDDLGERQKALDYLEQALALRRAANEPFEEGHTLNDIGWVYDEIGDRQKALDYYDQALPLERATGDRSGEGWTLSNMGLVYASLGERQKALDYYHQALSLARAVGDRTEEGQTLDRVGQAYASLEDKQKALDHYYQALTLRRAMGDRDGEVATLGHIASVMCDQGDLVGALVQIEAAIKIIESLRTEVLSEELRASYISTMQSNYGLYIDVLMRLHPLHPDDGNDAKALEVSERARARSLLEMLAEAQANIREGVDPALLEREISLKQLLKGKEAVQIKLLSGKHADEQAAALKKEIEDIQAQYEEVERKIRATSPRYAALTQPQPLSAPEIEQLLDPGTLLLEYALGDEHSYLWVVGTSSLRSFQLPKRSDVETAARRFYELLTARNKQAKGETEAQRWARLQRAEVQYPQAAATLSRMLLGRVAPLMKGKRLIIVADGALQYIPFSALPEPSSGRSASPKNARVNQVSAIPLVFGHEIVNLPSASALAVLRQEIKGRQPPPNVVAVLADPVFDSHDPRVKSTVGRTASGVQPTTQKSGGTRGSEEAETASLSASLTEDRLTRSATEVGMSSGGELRFSRLAFSRREAEAIVSAVPPKKGMLALDFKASLQTATDPELANYRIIHFATHGLLNSEHPELSGLVLSLVNERGQPQDGFLQLQDIYNLNLPADLVVLSACETGLGKEIRGEGLMGLTRGFMYAGAGRVIASLWKVDDVATAELMGYLYQGMLTKDLQPAAALRQSQIKMWKEKRWESPYYWAAFVVQGEWR